LFIEQASYNTAAYTGTWLLDRKTNLVMLTTSTSANSSLC